MEDPVLINLIFKGLAAGAVIAVVSFAFIALRAIFRWVIGVKAGGFARSVGRATGAIERKARSIAEEFRQGKGS